MPTNPFKDKIHISQQSVLVIILSTIVLLPNLVATFVAIDLSSFWMRLCYLIGSILIFLIPATVLKARWFFAFHSVTLIIGLVELTHLIINKATTSLLFVYTILISETGEAVELWSTAWPLILIVFLLFILYWKSIFHRLDNTYLFPSKVRRYIIYVILLSLALFGGAYKANDQLLNTLEIPIHNEKIRTEYLSFGEKIFPLNLIMHAYKIGVINQDIENQKKQLESFSFGIKKQKKRPKEIVVLVIGETARYGNFGINGYARNTTPRLSKRTNLISFDSTYAIANLTTVSVPFILSRATPQTTNLFNKEKSVVEAFQEAGYHTAWIANQSFGNKLLMPISSSCDYTHYLPADITNHQNLDIKLLDYLQPLLDKEKGRQFIVLHSLGCHFKYNCRYPKEFAQFQPDLNSETDVTAFLDKYNLRKLEDISGKLDNQPLMTEVKTLLVNSYDNAILYTDYFLDSTIERLEKTGKSCILIYVGDHGENLLDDDRHMFLHGTYSGSAYEYHVPMMVWYSNKYKRLHPQKIAALQENKSKRMSSMVIFNSLIDMASIHYANLDSSLSIVNPQLQNQDTIWGLDANLKLIEIPTQK